MHIFPLLSTSDQEGIQAQRFCAARVLGEVQDAGTGRHAVGPRGEEEAHFLAGSVQKRGITSLGK